MTRPLRGAHFQIWLLLALLLCFVFAAGLRARRNATPPNAALHWEEYR